MSWVRLPIFLQPSGGPKSSKQAAESRLERSAVRTRNVIRSDSAEGKPQPYTQAGSHLAARRTICIAFLS